MDYYDLANELLLHNHRDRAIDNYAWAALNVPAQVQAAASNPVCIDLTVPHTYI